MPKGAAAFLDWGPGQCRIRFEIRKNSEGVGPPSHLAEDFFLRLRQPSQSEAVKFSEPCLGPASMGTFYALQIEGSSELGNQFWHEPVESDVTRAIVYSQKTTGKAWQILVLGKN